MKWESAKAAGARFHRHAGKGHVHRWLNNMSRREFARAVTNAAIGAGLGIPQILHAESKGAGQPVPIPGGTPLLGGAFHVFGPAAIDPVDAEPSSIGNFNGSIALAYISGGVTRTDRTTGEVKSLNMIGSDMRFMSGVYKGTDGRTYQGSFAFV